MIVKMKKASLVVLDHDKEESLKQLRKLGVMHLEARPGEDDKLTELGTRQQVLSRGLFLLPDEKEADRREQQQRKVQRRPGRQAVTEEGEPLYKRINKEFAIAALDAAALELERHTLPAAETEAYWLELAGRIIRLTEKRRSVQEELEI